MGARDESGPGDASGGGPVLTRAVTIDARAAEAGYDWPDARSVRAKVDEELEELDRAIAREGPAAAQRELGDLLFALVSLARKQGLDAEAGLRTTLERFEARLAWAEQRAAERGRPLATLGAEELDALWREAKAALDGSPPRSA